MVQPAVVAQGDDPGAVDLVVADAVVAGDGEAWRCRGGLRPGRERRRGRTAAKGPVGPLVVVVAGEAVELGLEVGDGPGLGLLLGEPALEGLVEAFDLAG
jgi:hypothetical protein